VQPAHNVTFTTLNTFSL